MISVDNAFNSSKLQPLPFGISPNISGNINYQSSSQTQTPANTNQPQSTIDTNKSSTAASNPGQSSTIKVKITALKTAAKRPQNFPWFIIILMIILLMITYILKKTENK